MIRGIERQLQETDTLGTGEMNMSSRRPGRPTLLDRIVDNRFGGAMFWSFPDIGTIVNMVAAVGGIALAVKLGLKSIKRVPPGHYGVVETVGKLSGVTDSGLQLTDPSRAVQRIYVVNGQTVAAEFAGAGRGILADNTQIEEADVRVSFQVPGKNGAGDVVRRITRRPYVDLADPEDHKAQQFIDTVGAIADSVVTQVAPTIPNAEALASPIEVERFYGQVRAGIQKGVDRIFKFEPNEQRELDRATERNMRHTIDKGVVVTGVQILRLKLGTEVSDALQERAAVNHRVSAQVKLREALGPDYATYLNAEAAERVGENGATVVVGLGGGVGSQNLGDIAAQANLATRRRRGAGGGPSRTTQAEQRIKKHTG